MPYKTYRLAADFRRALEIDFRILPRRRPSICRGFADRWRLTDCWLVYLPVAGPTRCLGLEDEHGRESSCDSVHRAALEVARPMTFGIAIIIAVYLPILFLQGLEGRMFRPMAITVCAALLGSLVLALTVIPVFASLAFRKGLGKSQSNRAAIWIHHLNDRYERLLIGAMNSRKLAIGIAAGLLAVALGSLFFMGTEFMPRLDEGSIM